MATVIPEPNSTYNLAEFLEYVDEMIFLSTLTNQTSNSFTATWTTGGETRRAEVTGSNLSYTDILGEPHLTGGSISGIDGYVDNVLEGKMVNGNLSATEIAFAYQEEVTGNDPLAMENYLLGLDWNYEGTAADEVAIAGTPFGPNGATWNPRGDDFMDLGEGNDNVFSGDGNDYLVGGDGNDRLDGGLGRDILVGGLGADILQGGTDFPNGPGSTAPYFNDTASYAQAASGVKVTLNASNGLPGRGYGTGHEAVGDKLYNIEHLEGSNFDDVFTGNHFDNIIRGGNGNDLIFGLGGNDTLYAHDLDFALDEGADKLFGGTGNDRLFGDALNDQLFGQAGNDVIRTGDSEVANAIGTATDGILGSQGDFASGGEGNDMIYGGTGFDILSGQGGDDFIEGGDGNDYLSGGEGDDQLYGQQGDDVITAGAGVDLLEGGFGNDQLFGLAGNDELFGQDGDDLLSGGDGNDSLEGGAGQDRLFGANGDDLLIGGADSDTFIFSAGFGNDIVEDFAINSDNIDLQLLNTSYAALTDGDAANGEITQSGVDSLISIGTDSITLETINIADLDASDFMF